MTYLDLSDIRGLILDMDGVLWRADQPLGDLKAIFSEIRQRGYRVVLATNNSTLSADQYLEKLRSFGVSLERWQVVNSSLATAQFLHQRFPEGGPIYIVGENGLQQALSELGFTHAKRSPLAVVVGLDRQFNYEKMDEASELVRAGALFIGSNPDRTFPTPKGLIPGAGAILASIEAATGTKPFVIGKPAPEMYRVALQRLGTAPEETLVVGDRLETDIVGAQAIGCRTALVLSGVTTEVEARSWSPPPDRIAVDLASLLESL